MIFKVNLTTWEASYPTDMSSIPYFVSHIAVQLKGKTLIYDYNEKEVTVNVIEAHMLLIKSDRFAHQARELLHDFMSSTIRIAKMQAQYQEAAIQAGRYFYLYCLALKLESAHFPAAFDFITSDNQLKELWDMGFEQQENASADFLSMKLTESSPVH